MKTIMLIKTSESFDSSRFKKAEKEPFDQFVEAGLITNSEKNLRSKIDSILRSIENLTEKRLRIEYEIKKQKKSLYRKRQELKRSSKTTRRKISLSLESVSNSGSLPIELDSRELRRLDSILLEKSNRILEQD